MKQYQLIVNNLMGIEKGTLLFGPLPIKNSHLKGYYTQDNLPGAPSDQCLFQNVVENNPTVFEQLQDTKNPD